MHASKISALHDPDYTVLVEAAAAPWALVCFHFAGGSGQSFFRWKEHCASDFALVAAELPGRGRRLATPFVGSIKEAAQKFAAALRTTIDKPLVFYGHSLGALLAFETARVLKNYNLQAPLGLIVSSRAGPNSTLLTAGLPELSDQQLRGYLTEIEGTPKAVLEAPGWVEFVLPSLRADLGLIYDYRFEPQPVLDIPIVVIGAERDRWASFDALLSWRSVTTGNFFLRLIPGGHFAPMSEPEMIFAFARKFGTAQSARRHVLADHAGVARCDPGRPK
jgi:medium-chain acyl-[acyl-carrier-protein] hydrolase